MGSENHFTALPLELHTKIFSYCQPYDILQVSQTCQTLYLASLQRNVWTDALHRICVENILFKPSFPVASMSVLELQRASMGPHHWIARSSSKKRTSEGLLPHLATWKLSMESAIPISDEDPELDSDYLVPGGRYLFSLSSEWLALWDLGSPYSSDIESHIIATARMPRLYKHYLVHSTPDGLGLRIFLRGYPLPFHQESFSGNIYEIYPESTSPQFKRIAYVLIPGEDSRSIHSLSYDCLIFVHRNILSLWDYKANTWARWGIEGKYRRIVATKSAVTLIGTSGVAVWKIPPLLPESLLSLSTDPSVMPPEFELHYPENRHYRYIYQAPCDWYSGTPQPFYYDVPEDPYADPLTLNRFDITINSEISGGTLNLVKTFEVPSVADYCYPADTRICQDKNVIIYIDSRTGCLQTHVTDIYYNQQLPTSFTPLYHYSISVPHVTFCPVTGRVVLRKSYDPENDEDLESSIIRVLDF